MAIPEGDVKATFIPSHIKDCLEQRFQVTYNETGRQLGKKEMRTALEGQDAVLTGWGNCMLDQDVLEGNQTLKLIVHTGGTVGNLVDSYAYDCGIAVYSGNVMYAESTAEGALSYLLMAQRRIPDYIRTVKNGCWRTEADRWEGLLDKTVGIIGLSTVSKCLISYLRPFRVKIKLFTRYAPAEEYRRENRIKLADLDEIFETCDIVSVHSALNAENRKLIGAEHFAKLKDNALFVNTSRGAVIDEAALIEELKKGRIRAVLDVYEQEPLDAASPLRSLANVYAIPHMAGPTLDRREYITRALINEAEKFFAGETGSEFEITREIAGRMTKM